MKHTAEKLLTNAIIRNHNCPRVDPCLGIDEEAKRHHSKGQQCGASGHANTGTKQTA